MSNKKTLMAVLVFGLSALLLYVTIKPGLSAGYFFIDDLETLAQVPHHWSWHSLRTVFGLTPRAYYWPLNDLTYLMDLQFASLFSVAPPFMMRLTNIFYLSCTAVLLYFILNSIMRSTYLSAMAALLFALHPLHVIPTLWIASRKDVLLSLFTLLLLTFEWKRKRPMALLAFLFAFLAKPTAYGLLLWVFVHLFLQGTDEGKLPLPRQIWKTLIRFSPYLFLTALLLPASILLSQDHPSPILFLWDKSFLLFRFYVSKVFWPFPITQYYPRPHGLGVTASILSWILMISILVVPMALHRRRRCPYWLPSLIAFAFSCIGPYLLAVPAALYVNNAYAFTLVAPLVAALFLLFDSLKSPWLSALAVAIFITLLFPWLRHGRFVAEEFTDPVRAFERNVALYPEDRFIYTRLAHAAHTAGDLEKAKKAYERALQLRMKEDRRISQDAFSGLLSVCLAQKDQTCLQQLDLLAATNSTPFYCGEIANALKGTDLSTHALSRHCQKRWAEISKPPSTNH